MKKTVHLRILWNIKIKQAYFSPDGATEANDFLCSNILAALLTCIFLHFLQNYTNTILLTINFYGKKIVYFL